MIVNMRTLKEIKPGSSARVVKIHGSGAMKRRIMEMGIVGGVEVFVRKVAPLGDPMEITVRGYELTMRREDAESVEVE
jgi:ferrous iron transport protein A